MTDREKVAQAVADAIDLVLDEMDVPLVADQPIVRSATDRILALLEQDDCMKRIHHMDAVIRDLKDRRAHDALKIDGLQKRLALLEQEPVGERLRIDEGMLAFIRAEQRRTTDADPTIVVLARPQPTESCVCGHDRAQHQGAAPEAGTTSCDVCECSLFTRPQPNEGGET